jgi:ABC-type amino acid transport substrate-binding protein
VEVIAEMHKNLLIRYLLFVVCLLISGIADSQPLRYNLAEKQWLNQHQTLKIGVVELTPPLLFYAGGSSPQGLVADYLRAVALHLGLQLNIKRYPNRMELVQALQEGEVDALGSWVVGLGDTGGIIQSRPYLSQMLALYGVSEIPATGLRGLTGKPLAVLKDSNLESLENMEPGIEITPFETLKQVLQAAAHGEVYASLADVASVDYLMKRESFGDLEQQQQLDLTYDLALATRAADSELLSLLQKGLDRIAPDELQEIWHRWPGVERPSQYSAEISRWWLWIPLILLWSLFLVWSVYRYVVRKEQRHNTKQIKAIRRLQRRERALKEKLMILKRKSLEYRSKSRQQSHRLKLMDDVMPSAAWVWSPSSTSCQWDDAMFALYRQDPETFEPTTDAILALIYQEDKEGVASLFRQPEGESESRLSYRLVLPSGEIRRLLDFSYYSIDQESGEEQRIGLCWDVTDYHLSEEGVNPPQLVES